jgi:UDP-2,3-diacylglucosamine hydrolase
MGAAEPLLRIARDAPVAFASDLHLSSDAAATAHRALHALHRHATGRAHLFLLGDLFEMWVGDDGADALAVQVCVAYKVAAISGCTR